MKLPNRLWSSVIVVACAAVLVAASARAGTYTFAPGGGANDWWETTANWSPVGLPDSVNDVVVFNASGSPNYSTNTHSGSPYTVQELRFETSSAWRMYNNERDIALNGPGAAALVTQNGSGAITFDCDLRLDDTATFAGTGTGNIILNGSILTGTGQRLGIFGAGGLIKEGSYTLTINPAGSYSGGTTITSGTLAANHAAALGTGAVTMNGGTLNTSVNLANPIVLNATANTIAANGAYRQLSGPISGVGGFTLASGGGTPGLELTNTANDFAGNVTINSGTYLRLTAGEVLPNTASVINNGHLRLDVSGGGTETIAGLSGSGAVWVPTSNSSMQTLMVGANNTSSTFGGTVGSGGQNNAYLKLVKIGSGTLTLTGNNPFAGGVSIDGGVLSVNTLAGGTAACALGAALGTSGNLVFNGGTLRYTGPSVSGINRAFTINAAGATIDIADPATTVEWTDAAGAGPIIGAGTLTKAGPGTLTLSGANAYTGGTTISQGTILASNASGLGSGAVTLNNAGTGAANTALLATAPMAIANAITVADQGDGTSTIGTTNYTSGANMQFNGTLTLEKGVTLQAGSSDRTTFYGVISGTGDVTISSPFADNRRIVFDRSSGAANSFVGDIYLSHKADLQLGVANSIGNRTIPDATSVYFAPGSRLRFAPAGADSETIGALNSQASAAGTVDVFTGNSTFNLTIGSGGAGGDFSGVIQDSSGTLNLIKTGGGTQVLSGTNGYAGATTVRQGTLRVDGSIASSSLVTVEAGATLGGLGYVPGVQVLAGGQVAPGSSFGTLHSGAVTFAEESFFDVEISPGDGDRLDVEGLVALNGATLRLDPQGSFSRFGGSQYTIIDSRGPVGGTFDGLLEGATLEVDGSQFAITYAGGADRFDVVLTAVPEPATLGLLLLAAGGLGRYARRRRAA